MQSSELNEPKTGFEYPIDTLDDRIREYFTERYHGNLSSQDASWLAEFIDGFLERQTDLLVSNSEKRLAAQRMLRILIAIDEAMLQSKDVWRTWQEVAIALALPSICSLKISQASLGRSVGLTRAAIKKSVHKLCRVFEVEPAFANSGRCFRNLQQ
jgi:hypothetical protein